MIDSAVLRLVDQLNGFLRHRFGVNEDMVVVSHLLEQDGTFAPNLNDRLVALLVNLERENVAGAQGRPPLQAGDPRTVVRNHPPLHLNLYVLLAACFSSGNYAEGLKFLSSAVGFFQKKPVFSHENTPELDPGVEKLTVEIEDLDLQQLSHMWGILSGRYLPSVLYKIRMIAFDSGVEGEAFNATDPTLSVTPAQT